MSDKVELVLDAKAELGEGSIWHAAKQLLYWVDIVKGELHWFDPISGEDVVVTVGQDVGTVVARRSGGVMLAVHHGFAHLDLDTEELTLISDPEKDKPDIRFNDGKCDPAGRFWAGTLPLDERSNAANLYCMDTDLSVRHMLGNVSNSNGIVWSLDNTTMYYIDTPTREIAAFDYDLKTGAIANRKVAVTVGAKYGWPDGMTIDAEGMLWVALWGEGYVCRWDPGTGELLGSWELPVKQVTSCAFGGEKLDELYITSASRGLDEEARAAQPLAGGLFRICPGVRGVEAFEFNG